VGGWTRSTDLPVSTPLQATAAGGEDGLFAVLDADGTLRHLTYYGGSGDDRIRSVRLIYNTIPRVAGSTTSTDLPEVQRAQSRGQGGEGFWADIGTDQLIGTSQVILAKDGMARFSLQAAHALRRAGDLSLVGSLAGAFVYLGRSWMKLPHARSTSSGGGVGGQRRSGYHRHRSDGVPAEEDPREALSVSVRRHEASGVLSTWGNSFVLYAAYAPSILPMTSRSGRRSRSGPGSGARLRCPFPIGVFEMTAAGNTRQVRALRPGRPRTPWSEGILLLQPEQTSPRRRAFSVREGPPAGPGHAGQPASRDRVRTDVPPHRLRGC